jgi:hypothetical protein
VLRLWIERARARLAPSVSAGLVIGRDYAGLALVSVAGDGLLVQELAETRFESSLFVGMPGAEATAALTTALKTVAAGIAGRYLPLHVSLPDAAVRLAIFELDELPQAQAAQQELVQWRFVRDAVGGSPGVSASQEMGREGDKYLLLGMSMDKAWQRCIAVALAQAGLVAWSLSANACRQFNRYHDLLTTGSGALAVYSMDAWALLLWDEQGRVRHARARWRAEADNDAEIAAEVERSILAYVHGASNRTVERVHVVVDGTGAGLVAALDARLREPCLRLSADAGLEFASAVNRGFGSAGLSLAAALHR